MVWILQILLTISLCAHPFIKIDVSNDTPLQGEAIWITLNTTKKVTSGTVSLNGKAFKLFAHPRNSFKYLTCVGISRYTKPANQQLKFNLNFTDKTAYQTHHNITIKSANFKKEHITLKPKKYKLSQNKPKIKSEGSILSKKFKTITQSKKFNGPFLWPVNGRISSPFGNQRIYNNKPSWSHSGTDISAKKGTPIMATESGTVIFAKKLKVHGNTIMINHGWGIVSVYNHCDQLNVKETDKVKKGDIIGTVGSTGIATGDHLHFGISIQNIRVDPNHWVHHTSYQNI